MAATEKEPTSVVCNLGILDTLRDDSIQEIVESYSGFCATTEALLKGAGDLSVGPDFVAHVHSLCKHGLHSLVRDHFLRALEETFEKNGASKFWRHFDAYSNVAILSKNKHPICEGEVRQVLCIALEEIALEKQYQEKCLLMLVHALQSYNDQISEGRHPSNSERDHLFSTYQLLVSSVLMARIPRHFNEILHCYFKGSLEELSTIMAGEIDDENESQEKDDMDLDEKSKISYRTGRMEIDESCPQVRFSENNKLVKNIGKVVRDLRSLGFTSMTEDAYASAIFLLLKAKVHNLAGDDYRSSVLESIKGWIQAVPLQFLRALLAYLGDSVSYESPSSGLKSPLASRPSSCYPGIDTPSEGLVRWQLRLEYFAYETLQDLRIAKLFEIIVDYPDSSPAIEDLKQCLEYTGQHSKLVESFISAVRYRLLTAGASTNDILHQYVSSIKALRTIDPAGVFLEAVGEPIRDYLRGRKDTIKCIVTMLTDGSGGNPNVSGNTGDSLLEELNRDEESQENSGVDDDFITDDKQAWIDAARWEPDPVEADPLKGSRNRRKVDILGMIVGIIGSKDQLVNEYRVMLAEKLLNKSDYDIDSATARQKWKTAKDAAKKHASGLQAHLSRTFSRKKDFTHPEKLKILDQVKSDDDPIQHPSTSGSVAFLSSRVTSVEKKTEPSDLLRIMQEIEDDPDGCQGFNVGTGDKNMNIPVPKGKQTHTQIFSYAYSQLEKEKAQQEDNEKLTFSGIVKLATNAEIRKRPLLEISFKNLTLTLKAKNKHLLRCVTGEIKPGRITAVMGPSGAGKTTFLSAVAGKAIGCKMTGLILINGKNESIHSYKKIVGFVPQDDVVHGNLTVEENLWFSAKCRLSTDLSERDKVLVVERVIEFLGLQTVRSSLVGTVEKRGISGGQRKRVNVGLEMVMEPSLLILDEPTSGLDSASSLQLLRALRREALEGVNICMVVHQPSYALFKMFDDLILLAKGGLTVYHGPVKKVEEYFTGLGINIPERVNPPDHFIDILEGMVVPAGSSRVSYKDLPVRWMLHNGYSVPLDMQQNNAALSRSSMDVIPANETNPSGAGMEDHSFAREIWQGMKSNVVLQRDKLHLNFLKSKDLTNRRTPGAFQQYRYFLGRVGKQRLREARILAMDYLILLLAGACLGSLVKVKDQSFGADAYTYTIIAVSLLCKIAALRSFSLDKLHYWRESASGISSLAYFLSKDTIDHFNTVIKPAVYLSMFYFFTNPRSSFADNYIVLFCLVYCVTGIAYSLAIVFEPGTAQLCSVLLPVVLTLIATQPKDSEFMKILANLCYPKWALEAFVTANAERYYGVWLITRCGSLLKSGYNVHDWHLCIAILVSIGLVCRVIAFICMLIFQKK